MIDSAGLSALTGFNRERIRSWEHRNSPSRPKNFPRPFDQKLAGGSFYRAEDVASYLDE